MSDQKLSVCQPGWRQNGAATKRIEISKL